MDSEAVDLQHYNEAKEATQLYAQEMPEIEALVLPPIFSQVFFVVGTGRCGTLWLADLLSNSGFAKVYHEPNLRADRISIVCRDVDLSLAYIEKRRQHVLNALRSNLYYGEVNGYLLYHIDALRKVLNANLFLLVRNGVDVVRSWYARHTFDTDARTKYFNPEGETRFEQLCWWWTARNELAISKGVEVLRLEDLTTSWTIFNKAFGFLGIPKAIWENCKDVKMNATGNHVIASYDGWSAEQKSLFLKHCGNLMRRLGYAQN